VFVIIFLRKGIFMRKLLSVFLLLAFCISLCGCGKKNQMTDLERVIKRGKLVVGVRTDARPFGFIGEDDYNYGFDVDLASHLSKAILNKYENAVEYVPVTLRNRISYLNSGKVDCLIATMSITEKRSKLMDFSQPYHIAGQAILVNSWSKITTLKELDNKYVIIVYGSTTENNIRNLLPRCKIVGYKNYDDAVKALKAGKADALIADDTILLSYTYNDKSIKILPGRYSVEPYAVAFRKGAQSEKLREYTNIFLDQYARTGKLTKLQQKWGIKQ